MERGSEGEATRATTARVAMSILATLPSPLRVA